MNIKLPLKEGYETAATNWKPPGPWMPQRQEQEWEFIQSTLFQDKLRELRRRRDIKVSNAIKIYKIAFPDGVSKVRPRADDQEAWFKYSDRITPEDLVELRNTANLPSSFDPELKNALLLNMITHLPFGGCSVRADKSQRILRLVIDVFKWTSIGDISKYWRLVEQSREIMPICFSRSKKLAVDTSAPDKIMIVLGPNTTRDQVKKLWPQIKKLQNTLPGRSRFRVKENFGRDKIAAEKKRVGKRALQIQQEMPKMLVGKPFTNPDAIWQADYRRRLKIRSK